MLHCKLWAFIKKIHPWQHGELWCFATMSHISITHRNLVQTPQDDGPALNTLICPLSAKFRAPPTGNKKCQVNMLPLKKHYSSFSLVGLARCWSTATRTFRHLHCSGIVPPQKQHWPTLTPGSSSALFKCLKPKVLRLVWKCKKYKVQILLLKSRI